MEKEWRKQRKDVKRQILDFHESAPQPVPVVTPKCVKDVPSG